jgi:hypothetical protein
VPTAPPLEPPPAGPPPKSAGLITDREMPGWLEDELDNGWRPAPEWEYDEDTGYIVGMHKPQPGSRHGPADDSVEQAPPRRAPRRRPEPKPAPEPPPPGRLLTLYLQRSGDSNRDRQKLRRLHGFLTQYPGNDRFRIILEGEGYKRACLEFPNHAIGINDDILRFAADMLGENNIEIGDLGG